MKFLFIAPYSAIGAVERMQLGELRSTPRTRATSSMHRDIAAGRPSELDALIGAVVRLGRDAGVATPVSAQLYGALAPLERQARANAR
jgi:ketopantoate reductase